MFQSIIPGWLRFAIPPLVAVVAWAVWVGVSSIAAGSPGPIPLFALLTLFLVILTLAIAGAATPFPLIAGILSFHGRIQTMFATVFYAFFRLIVVLRLNHEDGEAGGAG